MERSIVLMLTAVALIGLGLWRLIELLPLVATGTTDAGLFAGRAAECVFALLAGIGVWLRKPWGAVCIWLTALAIACVALYEAFVPGILALVPALVIAVVALVVAAVLTRSIRPELGTS